MIFSGVSTLLLPGVDSFNFLFKNVVVSNTGTAVLTLCTRNSTRNLTLSGGAILGFDGVSRIATFNTGEAFNITGCKTYWVDGTTDRWYINANNGVLDYNTSPHETLSGIIINNYDPNTYITCDVEVQAPLVNYNVALPSPFTVGTVFTGLITSSVDSEIFGFGTTFYQSFEQSLLFSPSGGELLTGNIPNTIIITDNDSDPHNQLVNFNLTVYTSQGDIPYNFSLQRMGRFLGQTCIWTRLDSGNTMSGLFNGVWTGSTGFIYQDRPQFIQLSYGFSKTDGNGQRLPTTGYIQLIPYNPVPYSAYVPALYVNQFTLTTGGEYVKPPIALFSGYYAVTGIQQAFQSLLFGSGCTGPMIVTYTGYGGVNATGQLLTTPVQFSGIYVPGVATFYTVTGYTALNLGSGYTYNPQAYINTGGACYDAPTYFGSNVAWFLPWNTSGLIAPQAAYLTGEVLTTTGLVSGGAVTGLIVTGLNITNIGSGYNTGFFKPLVTFIRNTGDFLTKNASGVFGMNITGFESLNGNWTLSYNVDNGDYTGVIPNNLNQAITMQSTNQVLNIQIGFSGVANTGPIQVIFQLTTETGIIQEYITDLKYYSTDTGFLKKKLNVNATGTFLVGSDLSFVLGQDALDSLYSSYSFTNNTWTIQMGDLNF